MESSYTTTRQETRSSTTTSGDSDFSSGGTYHPRVSQRSVVIQRSYGGGGGGAGGLGSAGGRAGFSRERSMHYSTSALTPGAYAAVSSTGVNVVKQSREQEKRDMQDLNERFASYIEKVRFLEAQNRRLADELEKLKSKWGKETSQIKAIYQAELDEARKLLDDATKEKARLEIRVASLEEQLDELNQRLSEANRVIIEYKENIERQNQQLSDYEAELGLLRRRVEGLESDRDRDKKLIAQLQEALNRARADLDNETLLHIDAENRRQTLEEELEFLKTVHEQELKELAALAYRDTTKENRDFWKNEMGSALREIQNCYDEKLDLLRGELEANYSLKIQEFRTGATKQNMETVHSKEETKRLRGQLQELRDKHNDQEAKIAQLCRELEVMRRDKEERERELDDENNELKIKVTTLQAEIEAILKELQDIVDTKLGLELEIAAYRKLLDGEEQRGGLKQLVDTWALGGGAGGGSSSQSTYVYESESSSSAGGAFGAGGGAGRGGLSAVIKGEMSAKTTYQKNAKGPVSIAECGSDGKYVLVDNTGRKSESLDGWRIQRAIDGEDKVDYGFESGFVIPAGAKVKIWAKGSKPRDAPATDFEFDESTWGVGANITTKLVNPAGESRATHIQKTTYS